MTQPSQKEKWIEDAIDLQNRVNQDLDMENSASTKPSEIFEGNSSSLHKTFDEAICPHTHIENNMVPDTCRDCGQVLISTSSLREEYSTANFISTYMNDHNRGTPRWLRSIFFNEKEKIEKILEYMEGIEAKHNADLQSLLEEVVDEERIPGLSLEHTPDLAFEDIKKVGRNEARAHFRTQINKLIRG